MRWGQIFFVRKIEKGDDLDGIIRMLHRSNAHRLPFVFDDEDEAVRVVKILMDSDCNEYSHENFWICLDEKGIVQGAIHAYDPQDIDAKESIKEYTKALRARGIAEKYREWRMLVDHTMLGPSLYIHNIAYASEDNKFDVASALGFHIINVAREQNFECIYTDILSENTTIVEFMKKMGLIPNKAVEDHGRIFVRMIEPL